MADPARGRRRAGRDWPRRRTQHGGRRASRARRRSTPPSPRRAEVEYLYDGPTPTMPASASPGRSRSRACRRIACCRPSEEELIDDVDAAEGKRRRRRSSTPPTDFAAMVIDYLKAAGVQQSDKGDRITSRACTPWPGNFIGAERHLHRRRERPERRAAILIGPEYGTRRPAGPRRRRARGGRCALRRADRLRLQLRRPCLRAGQPRQPARSSRPDEPRHAHGRTN